MLDKLVIHLKNIIFFKIIIYILLIILLGVLIPNFQNNFERTSSKKQEARAFLQEASLKLLYIKDFEKNIFSINQAYSALVNDNIDSTCTILETLGQDVQFLEKKYNLFTPISTQTSTRFEGKNYSESNYNKLKINYNQVEILFRSSDYLQLLDIIQDLYNFLPDNSLIFSINIRAIEGLTPIVIENLNTNKAPDMLEANTIILLRNVIYEK